MNFEVLLTPADYWLDFLVLGALCLAAFSTVFLKPQLLSILATMAAILGAGPYILGYGIYDEAILVALLAGTFLALFTGRLHLKKQKLSLHSVFFFCLMGWIAFQSIRGVVVQGDIRLLRYFLYFASLFCLGFLIPRIPEADWIKQRQATLILAGCTALFILYYLHGQYYESALGLYGRFALQGHRWSGSAYAFYPIFLGIPCAFLFFERNKILSAVFLATIFYVGLYFDSRICIGVFLLYGFVSLTFRNFLALYIVTLIAVLGLLAIAPEAAHPLEAQIIAKLNSIVEGGQFIFNPRVSDRDRQAVLIAGLKTSWQSASQLLFGSGYYSSKKEMIPALTEYTHLSLYRGDTARPTGMPAFLVDTGLVGAFFLFGLLGLVLQSVVARLDSILNRNLRLFTLIPLVGVGWLMVSNILDCALLFLLLMPGGPVFALLESKELTKKP